MMEHNRFDLIKKSRQNAKKLKKEIFDQYMEDYIYSDLGYLNKYYIFKELNNHFTLEILNKSNQPLYKEDRDKREHQNNLFFELILSIDHWYINTIIRRYGCEVLEDENIGKSYYYTLYAIKVFILRDIEFWNKLFKYDYFLPFGNDKFMFFELMKSIGGNDLYFSLIDTLQCYILDYKKFMQDGTIKKELDDCLFKLEDSYQIMKSLINMSFESGRFLFTIDRFSVTRW